MIAHGAKMLSASAAGSRISSLFFSDPRAMRNTIGSSRAGAKPVA